jgi:hypothetical protein
VPVDNPLRHDDIPADSAHTDRNAESPAHATTRSAAARPAPSVPEIGDAGRRRDAGDSNTREQLAAGSKPRSIEATATSAGRDDRSIAGISPDSPAPHDDAARQEWRAVLSAAIRALEDDLKLGQADGRSPKAEDHEKLARLRLLYLAAGRRGEAMRTPEGVAAGPEQEFLTKTMYGLSTYLEASRPGSDSRRGALAASTLREAVALLGEQSALEVRNLAFCRRVVSFGVYESFLSKEGKYEFQPNQEVLLYAEVENFLSSGDAAAGYATTLRASYEILGPDGRRIGTVHNLGTSKDVCRNRRSDFFVRYFVNLPQRLNPGEYRLRLTVEDVSGNKAGEAEERFTIVDR